MTAHEEDKAEMARMLADAHDVSKIGDFEGDRCNRTGENGLICEGTMDYLEVEDCRCHLYAPCNACTENPVVCTICGASEHDE